MNRLAKPWMRVSSMVRFIVVFVSALIALAIVFPWLSARYNREMMSFMSATAWLVGQVLKLAGQDVSILGRFIHGSGFSIEVIEECTGVYEILIFWAAVLAYPSRWPAKAAGFIGGAISLIILNVIRMVILYIVGHYQPDWFEFMHTYFWQATLILLIATVWIAWIKLVASRPPRRGA